LYCTWHDLAVHTVFNVVLTLGIFTADGIKIIINLIITTIILMVLLTVILLKVGLFRILAHLPKSNSRIFQGLSRTIRRIYKEN